MCKVCWVEYQTGSQTREGLDCEFQLELQAIGCAYSESILKSCEVKVMNSEGKEKKLYPRDVSQGELVGLQNWLDVVSEAKGIAEKGSKMDWWSSH